MADIDKILGYGSEGSFHFGAEALENLNMLTKQVDAPFPAATINYALR